MPDGGSFGAWRGWRAGPPRHLPDDGSPLGLVAVFECLAILDLQWAARCLARPPGVGGQGVAGDSPTLTESGFETSINTISKIARPVDSSSERLAASARSGLRHAR